MFKRAATFVAATSRGASYIFGATFGGGGVVLGGLLSGELATFLGLLSGGVVSGGLHSGEALFSGGRCFRKFLKTF